jgi:hypothetical protein
MALAALVVRLGLDAAEYFSGLTKAEASAAKFAEKQKQNSKAIDRQVKSLQDAAKVYGLSAREAKLYELAEKGATAAQLKSADAALKRVESLEKARDIGQTVGKGLLALGAAAGAAAVGVAVLFEKALDGAASFQDLQEKTGASAEILASFQVSADVAAVSLETIGAASVKLTKGLAGADEETAGAAQAIKKLGFEVSAFQKLDPGVQIEEIAKKLAELGDGSTRTAAAVQLFGKSGAELLPFLLDLAAQGGRNVVLTQAQIKAADDYKDAQARLISQVKQYAQVLAVQALPVVVDFQAALFESAKAILGVEDATKSLNGSNGVESFATKAARSLAVLVDGLEYVVKGFEAVGLSIAARAAQVALLFEGNIAGVKQVEKEVYAATKAIQDRPLFSQRLEDQTRRREFEESPEVARLRNAQNLRGTSGSGRLTANDFGANTKSTAAADNAKKLLDKQLSDLDNFIKAESTLLGQRNSALDRLYGLDLISIQAYFDAKANALELNTQASIAAYEKQIKAIEASVATSKKAADQTAAQTKIGDIQQKIDDAQADSASRLQKLQDDKTRALQAYGDKVAEVADKVLELAATEEAAARAATNRFDRQSRQALAQATAQGDQPTIDNFRVLRDREEAQARVNVLMKDASAIQDALTRSEQRINLERDIGLRSDLASQAQLGQARAAALPQLRSIADRYEEIANQVKDPQMLAAADAFRLKIDELAATTDVLAEKFRSVFVESFTDGFADIITGAKSAEDAVKDFLKSISNQLARMASQEIGQSIFGKGGSAGGIGSILSDLFSGMASSGGQDLVGVFAGGTDFVPETGLAMVHRGERIITAADNRSGKTGDGGVTVNLTQMFAPGTTRETTNQAAAAAALQIQRSSRRNN